jgi:fluoride exporter
MRFVILALSGAIGGLCRYLVSGVVQGRSRSDFPLGTLAVNLAGAFVFGLVAGLDDLESTLSLTTGGFMGGFTTFSTWMVETVRLGVTPIRSVAAANLTVTLLAGVILVAAGYSLTT